MNKKPFTLVLAFALLVSMNFLSSDLAHADNSKVFEISNEYLEASTSISQPLNKNEKFVGGKSILQIKISKPSLSNIPCTRNPPVDFGNGITHSSLAIYWVTIYDNQEDAEIGKEGIWSASVNIFLDSKLEPILQDTTENYPSLSIQSNQNKELKSHKILENFTFDGQQFTSNKFEFQIDSGQKYFVKQYIDLAAWCSQGRTSGSFSLGGAENISSIETEFDLKYQEIFFSPIKYAVLKNKFIKLESTSSNGLPLNFLELTPKNCIHSNGILFLKKAGACKVKISQDGDAENLPAKSVTVDFLIYSKMPSTKLINLICENDQNLITVTSQKPKCPKGYKKVN